MGASREASFSRVFEFASSIKNDDDPGNFDELCLGVMRQGLYLFVYVDGIN
jgi:hypothetical protein